MHELRLAAKAYYNNSSIELQSYAYHFFASMDANGDGHVSSGEFGLFLRQNGYDWIEPGMFAELDADNNGTLDFWEFMAFYYVVKTRAVWCKACYALLPGLYFTCLTCFDSHGLTTFDVCSVCYGARSFRHDHAAFVDSYVLLRCKKEIAPGMNNTQEVQPQYTSQEAGTLLQNTNQANASFKAMEIAIGVGHWLGVGSTIIGCTIM